MIIELGRGKYKINNITEKGTGRRGILFQLLDFTVPVGSKVPGHEVGEEYIATENDVVIYFDNLPSARVLQDQVNICCLAFDGMEVVDHKMPKHSRQRRENNGE